MTWFERAQSFRDTFPKQPASWPWLVEEDKRPCVYAIWVIGANYGNESGFYGAYPKGFLKRLGAFFPDVLPGDTLHAFSGSLPEGAYFRMDSKMPAEFAGNVYDARALVDQSHPGKLFTLTTSDPPYSSADAVQYGTPMVDRRRAIRALAQVTKPGGFMAWLDTCWPIHRKTEWVTVGRILVQRSTNHRARVLTIFQRQA